MACAVDVDEEKYGVWSGAGSSRLAKFVSIEGRPRAFRPSSSFSLSPAPAVPSAGQEFPFIIGRPPSTDILDDQHQQLLSVSPPELITAPGPTLSTDGNTNLLLVGAA